MPRYWLEFSSECVSPAPYGGRTGNVGVGKRLRCTQEPVVCAHARTETLDGLRWGRNAPVAMRPKPMSACRTGALFGEIAFRCFVEFCFCPLAWS